MLEVGMVRLSALRIRFSWQGLSELLAHSVQQGMDGAKQHVLCADGQMRLCAGVRYRRYTTVAGMIHEPCFWLIISGLSYHALSSDIGLDT